MRFNSLESLKIGGEERVGMKFGKKVCERIREIRVSMKLTQSQFAEITGLSQDGVGKIERGDAVPTIDTLYKIATGLKIPIEKFLPPEKKAPTGRQNKAIEDFVVYLKTRSSDDVKFIHGLAVQILEKKK